ncbi:efflux RND transporter periplasmic adaptor subunit [Pseudalkalibacillus salsuginis]|uniref:efflux RND transporter periplasmic adaptor subunit n=1 Tax=Pseudalkalibacillus salsuginis TaxID=2910972 RepID=UPI001F1C747D|nr:efflux RND transporter periplasmic adaptor subunit [Pseudalkalibacillus salsuginis]MCF6409270.1 efflux RND transporter periplasmic adaptor subunit [Pseudalkalibacillus salsuginis]
MNRHMKRALIGLPILLFIILNTYLFLLNQSLFASEKPYEVAKIENRDLRETMKASGTIIPLETQEIYNEAHRGVLEEVLVQEGDEVSAGSEILKYQSTDIENQITTLENEIKELETEQDFFEERETTLAGQIRTESDKDEEEKNESSIFLLEQQKADASYQTKRIGRVISSKESEVKQLESKLDEKVVKTNVAGTVQKVNVIAGSGEEPVVVISSEDQVMARAYLSEDDVLFLREGDEVEISASRGGKRKGVITDIGPAGESKEDLKFPVDIELDLEGENRLPIGSTLEVTMKPVAVENALAVKHEWVLHNDGEAYVLVVKNDYIDKRKVSFGFENEAYKEVSKGLKAEETIMTDPNIFLVEGMEIESKSTGKKKSGTSGASEEQQNPEDEEQDRNESPEEEPTSDPADSEGTVDLESDDGGTE